MLDILLASLVGAFNAYMFACFIFRLEEGEENECY